MYNGITRSFACIGNIQFINLSIYFSIKINVLTALKALYGRFPVLCYIPGRNTAIGFAHAKKDLPVAVVFIIIFVETTP
ncbi:hypothetical protein D3C85_1385530 [compost metagenome]